MTYDLTKLEEKFWQFIKACENYDKNEILITEELITKAETLYILFRQMSYFLVIEDEKPVIFAYESQEGIWTQYALLMWTVGNVMIYIIPKKYGHIGEISNSSK